MIPSIAPMGDAALVATFAAALSDDANDRAIALAASLRADAIEGVLDVVPAMTSVTVHLDAGAAGLAAAIERLRARIEDHAAELSRCADPGLLNLQRFGAGRLHDIPVVYDGPDLDDVAAFAGCSAAEVVARHTAREYRVYMLGFLPGFAYLGPVDASIAAPRRSSPRLDVPAGSVGIAGAQTGVYPQVSPGGWQLVGRTATRLFDPQAGALLRPGDRVRFVAEPAR